MTRVRTSFGSSTTFGPGSNAYAIPPTVIRAAAGRPVLSATQCRTTTTPTAASTNSRVDSTSTGPSFLAPDRDTDWRDAHRSRSSSGIPARSRTLAPDMDLFAPVTLGDLELANRVVMAPLTRMRAGASGVPNDLLVE